MKECSLTEARFREIVLSISFSLSLFPKNGPLNRIGSTRTTVINHNSLFIGIETLTVKCEVCVAQVCACVLKFWRNDLHGP